MDSITQDMRYKPSLVEYAIKHEVARASRKYNRGRSTIYSWKQKYDGTIESLANKSRRPHSHPNQHTVEELKRIENMRRRNPKLGLYELWSRLSARGYARHPVSLYRVMKRLGMYPKGAKEKKKRVSKPYELMQYPGQRVQVDVKHVPRSCIADGALGLYQYTAIDEYSRLRFLGAYEEISTYSSADFLRKLIAWYARRNIAVECVQTDNGSEFTNRLANGKRDIVTLFEWTAMEMGIRHKLIRPYTPRHNGKVERSHREDQKRFYSERRFYSLADFGGQLAAHQSRTNNIPMRPLKLLSPIQFLASSVPYDV